VQTTFLQSPAYEAIGGISEMDDLKLIDYIQIVLVSAMLFIAMLDF
jgi:hypothetical protein